ncbi:response regulator [Timonella senegalensis]|jgi:DNA-binding NarL/FixJ family response regulator|uniref:response regulator n=2 Tax=Timonella senegalensis TaxID=1465825 RepID=UPI0002E42EA8|nr:response regulator transcription factor [Timonella senegalensis]
MISPDSPIKVAIVDDQQLLRAGFKMVIDSQPDLHVVAEAGDGASALSTLKDSDVDVVLMDIRMPEMDGLAVTAKLTEYWSAKDPSVTPRILILTTFDLDEYALEAIRAGASGFLLKDAPPEEMLNAIRTVHEGDAVIAPSTTRRLLGRLITPLPAEQAVASPHADKLASLTEREMDVLMLIAKGMSNTEIARELFVAEATVKTHVGRILHKLGARDRVQIVVTAYENGLVKPGE